MKLKKKQKKPTKLTVLNWDFIIQKQNSNLKKFENLKI